MAVASQIIDIGNVVTLRLAERPGSGPTQVFETEMSKADFLSAANRQHMSGVYVGQFLEVLVTKDQETRILLRQRTHTDPERLAFDLLAAWNLAAS